ncbi:MAG: sialic acid synthase SpsE [Flavobacteriales bacterium]|jgi:sialic acid synthase SpsE
MTTRFIAEVSSNHHQDINRCKQFIKVAADIGCDAVKFQLFKIDQLFSQEILNNSEKHRMRKHWELPVSYLPELKACCLEQKIEFSCTPFYLEAVEELAPYVDFLKIASYELLWNDLLIACAKTQLPIVLSTGMATIEEVDQAIEQLHIAGAKDITLLHCVSAYPTPPAECNLAVIELFRSRYSGVKVGWSDHTVSAPVLQRAIHRWQADTVEFHIDLDRTGEEYSQGHCWLPEEMRDLIDGIRIASVTDGAFEKRVSTSEAPDRAWRADPIDGLRPIKSERDVFLRSIRNNNQATQG